MITYGARHFPPLLCWNRWALTSLFAFSIEIAGTFLLKGPEGSTTIFCLHTIEKYRLLSDHWFLYQKQLIIIIIIIGTSAATLTNYHIFNHVKNFSALTQKVTILSHRSPGEKKCKKGSCLPPDP